MKGYKAFNKGLTCRGFQFEVGKTYKHDGEIGLCEAGFHFCKTASDCANHYDHTDCEFAEIEAIGKVIEGDDKCVTDEIAIVGLISRAEFYDLANNGKNNLGVRNTGNYNTGDGNTGGWNTGYRNTGDWNTGYKNTGHGNTGDLNTGDWNTGDKNTGDLNTGDRNTGDWNTGNWNATNRSAGFFCTELQTVKLFDRETGKTYEELKELLPKILWQIPFGYYWINDQLKAYTAKDRQKFYDKLSDSEKAEIKSIPCFNADKFEKCTGIKVED